MQPQTSGISARGVNVFAVGHVAFGIALVAMSWADVAPGSRWLVVTGVIGSAGTVAVRVLTAASARDRLDTAVAVGLVAWWALAVAAHDALLFQQFSLYPLIYFLVPVRTGMAIAAVPMVVSVADELRDDDTTAIVLFVTIGGWLGGAAMARWIQHIYIRADAWQDMAMRLEAAQAGLAQAERAAGAAAARRRFAAEVHDTVAQSLTGIVLHCEQARQTVTDPEAVDALDRVEAIARSALTDARRLVADSPSTPLAIGDPVAAIRETARSPLFADLEVVVHVEGDLDDVDGPRSTTMHRVVHEALNNVAKHAGASRVDVSVARIGDVLAVDVADDGRGFDPADRPGAVAGVVGGTGLRDLRDQVELLGGSLAVETGPTGTVVSASLPSTVATRATGGDR